MRNLFGRLISYLMVVFSGLIFVNAIHSEHFSFKQMPKRVVFIWVALFFIGGLLSLSLEKVVVFLQRIKRFFSEEIILLIGHELFGLGILFQILCITLQPGMAQSDPGGIFLFAYSEGRNDAFYFSENPNNLFLYCFIRLFRLMFHFLNKSDFLLLLQIVNVIAIALFVWIIYLVGSRLFFKRVGIMVYFLGILAILFSPWGYVVYTDTLSLPLIAVVLQILTNLFINKRWLYLKSVGAGILTGLTYLMKPSAILFMFSLFLVILLSNWNKSKQKKILFFAGCCLMLGFSVTKMSFAFFIKHQSMLVIDDEKAKPMTHFIMMGLTDKGGFSGEDVIATNRLPSRAEKVKMNLSVIFSRLQKLGLVGYFRFLLLKNEHNTRDGSFGWGGEDCLLNPVIRRKNFISKGIFETFFNGGRGRQKYYFFAQVVWTGIALLMFVFSLVSFSNQSWLIIWLKLSLIAGFVFLLLFEGGRSRYLIQFLPFLLLYAALGAEWSVSAIFNRMKGKL
ncbi:MAG: glycosyltransferase family 39 protein [Streptococcaceae bacterium]|jgi:integral membrane protein (TIGR03766 family)|nr:glycosyltransferase family 39 protein [Streptococcaceae bacterium]